MPVRVRYAPRRGVAEGRRPRVRHHGAHGILLGAALGVERSAFGGVAPRAPPPSLRRRLRQFAAGLRGIRLRAVPREKRILQVRARILSALLRGEELGEVGGFRARRTERVAQRLRARGHAFRLRPLLHRQAVVRHFESLELRPRAALLLAFSMEFAHSRLKTRARLVGVARARVSFGAEGFLRLGEPLAVARVVALEFSQARFVRVLERLQGARARASFLHQRELQERRAVRLARRALSGVLRGRLRVVAQGPHRPRLRRRRRGVPQAPDLRRLRGEQRRKHGGAGARGVARVARGQAAHFEGTLR